MVQQAVGSGKGSLASNRKQESIVILVEGKEQCGVLDQLL